MSLFLRVFQHLLPDAEPWRLAVGKTLTKFFEGLSGAPTDARAFVDSVYEDLSPETTRQITEWESQFGIPPNPLEAVRRANIAAEWLANGGQSPKYIQDVLQTAGFDVYVHDWWSSGPNPYVVRDPRSFTLDPLIGTIQCGESLAQCGEPLAECNNILNNDPHYIVNKDLTERAPPPIPDPISPELVHPAWRHFWYVGGETFPDIALVPLSRKAEFQRLLLKVKPAQTWIVTLVEYLGDS
jgi:hypothetical protein